MSVFSVMSELSRITTHSRNRLRFRTCCSYTGGAQPVVNKAEATWVAPPKREVGRWTSVS